MEAEPAPDFAMLRELLAPPCLNPEPPPEPPIRQAPRTPACLRPSGRSFWPAHQDSVTALRFLQETAEELAQTPWDTQALGPYWEPKALETLGPLPQAKDDKNMLTPVSQQSPNLGPPRAPLTSPAQPQRRPRKQSNPQRGAEKVDPLFEGVTLKFQIKPDSSLQIIPSYSLACSSRSPGPPTPGPARGPEANPGGSEALGESWRLKSYKYWGKVQGAAFSFLPYLSPHPASLFRPIQEESQHPPSTQAESPPPPASSSAELCHLSPFLAFPLS